MRRSINATWWLDELAYNATSSVSSWVEPAEWGTKSHTDLSELGWGTMSRKLIRHEALRAPRSIEHLVGSFENAAVTLHKEPTSENAQIFYELRAKFATFLMQSQPDGPSAEVFGQRMRRIMPIIWRLDSDLDPNTRMLTGRSYEASSEVAESTMRRYW